MNRSNLQDIGRRVNAGKGQRWFSGKVVESIMGKDLAVIDGVRFLEDKGFMSERFGPAYTHIHVQACEQIRLDRLTGIAGEDIPLKEAIKSKTEQEIVFLEGVADAIIENNSSISSLYKKIDKLLGGD